MARTKAMIMRIPQDILGEEVVGVEALRHLPAQLGELRARIGEVLLVDLKVGWCCSWW